MKNKETDNIAAPPKKSDIKSKLIWTLVFVVLAVMSVFAVTNMSKDFTVEKFLAYIADADPLLICVAVIAMLGFIFFEALAVLAVVKGFGYRQKFIHGLIYSASDIYVSAITPSATGGQPASAYYMVKDGMDAGATTFTLVFNLIAYTAAILVIGVLAFIFRPRMFPHFEFFVKFLIIAGIVLQTLLLGFFIACMWCHKAVLKAGNGLISLLARMKIVKNTEKWRGKLTDEVEKYRLSFMEIRKHRALFFQALLLNVAQRVSQVLITCFVCTAADPDASFVDLFAMQAFVLLGYNSIPLPGGVGAFEYLYLNIYTLRFDNTFIVVAMMVTRVISYYLCMALSGVVTLVYHIRLMKRKRQEIPREKSEDEEHE